MNSYSLQFKGVFTLMIHNNHSIESLNSNRGDNFSAGELMSIRTFLQNYLDQINKNFRIKCEENHSCQVNITLKMQNKD